MERKEVIDRFLEISGQSDSNYGKYVLQMKELEACYSREDIMMGMDYLLDNPPPKGFFSLRYLLWQMPKILYTKRALAELEQLLKPSEKEMDIEQSEENKTKYQAKARKGIKGTVQF